LALWAGSDGKLKQAVRPGRVGYPVVSRSSIRRGDFTLNPADMDPLEQTIRANIEKFGWGVQLVNTNDEHPWAYTIGVYQTLNLPELMISGVELSVAHAALNQLVRSGRDGSPISPGHIYKGVLPGGVSVRVFEVDAQWYDDYFGRAIDIYEGPNFPMLQVLWSDTQGHFPWDTGFDPACEGLQAFLFHPEAWERGMADLA
jgi:hypothetical protein